MTKDCFRIPTRPLFCGLMLLILVALLCSLALGEIQINVISFLFSQVHISHSTSVHHEFVHTIFFDIRLPRTLLAGLVGCLLAVSGAMMQGIFRNPLADPSLIGVTAGASLGASLMILFGQYLPMLSNHLEIIGLTLTTLGACIGGGLTVIVVYNIATQKNSIHTTGTSVTSMLLTGIAITAIVSGISNLLDFFSDNTHLRRMSLWRMGSLEGANYFHITLAAGVCLAFLYILPKQAHALNAMLLGESEARHLGINIIKTKRHIIILTALGIGIAVSLAGTIGFIGLLVPHLMRLLVGPNHRLLLPASALAGATLLMFADTAARTLMSPTELPVGVITAFLGAPVFIWLIRHRYELEAN